MIHHLKAWQRKVQPRINEALAWKREVGPLLAEMATHQRDSALALQAIISEIQRLRSNDMDVAEPRETTVTPSETLVKSQDPDAA